MRGEAEKGTRKSERKMRRGEDANEDALWHGIRRLVSCSVSRIIFYTAVYE